MKWISVKDRLPDSGDDEFLVVWDLQDGYNPVSTMMIFNQKNQSWIDIYTNSEYKDTVLFWMPLPKPPKK